MPTVLTKTDQPVDQEVDELRQELERLQGAIGSLTQALAEANRARGAAESDLAQHRLLLEQARGIRMALEDRLGEVERDLWHERTASAIRAKLIADIRQARAWARRRAIRRAGRVEQLLDR
jgi:chromosome segregation ATPase